MVVGDGTIHMDPIPLLDPDLHPPLYGPQYSSLSHQANPIQRKQMTSFFSNEPVELFLVHEISTIANYVDKQTLLHFLLYSDDAALLSIQIPLTATIWIDYD